MDVLISWPISTECSRLKQSVSSRKGINHIFRGFVGKAYSLVCGTYNVGDCYVAVSFDFFWSL